MSTATCEERITQPDSPKRSRPPGVAPLFRLSGVARRLQTAAGYAHSSRLERRKIASNAARLDISAGYQAAIRVQKTKWPSRGTATLLPSVARTGTLCWKFVSKTFLRQKAAKVLKKSSEKKKESVGAKKAQRGKSKVSEAERYFGSRVCTSPLRSNHNTRRNGISEGTKKTRPPRR